MTGLHRLGAAELSEAFANGRLSPVEAVQAARERIDRREPAINAMYLVHREQALADAREAAALHLRAVHLAFERIHRQRGDGRVHAGDGDARGGGAGGRRLRLRAVVDLADPRLRGRRSVARQRFDDLSVLRMSRLLERLRPPQRDWPEPA